MSKYFSAILFIALEALASSFETLEGSRKVSSLEGTCSIHMEKDCEIPRLKRLHMSILLRHVKAFLYGITAEQAHPVCKDTESLEN